MRLLTQGGVAAKIAAATLTFGLLSFGGSTMALAATPMTHTVVDKSAPLPSSVDLTQWAVPAGQQLTVGACTAWAVGYTMMGWYSNRGGDEQAFAPMYIYSQTHITNDADGGGAYISDTYKLVENQGIDTQSDYTQGNYSFTSKPTTDERANAAQYRTGTYHTLFETGVLGKGVGSKAQGLIEAGLATGNPVGISFPIYASFRKLNTSDDSYSLGDATGANQGGHYAVVLGYDSQGVTIENSWGPYWGNQGFAKISWDFINSKVDEADYMEGVLKYIPASSYRAPGVSELDLYPAVNGFNADWMPPTDPGTTDISSYVLTVAGGGSTHTYKFNADGSYKSFRTLKPGVNYKVTLTAYNSLGLGTATSKTVRTLSTAPALHGLTVKTGKTSAKISWHAASPNRGYITKYTVAVVLNGKTLQRHTYAAGTRSATVKGLKPGRSYMFTLAAYDSAGKHAAGNYTGKTKV